MISVWRSVYLHASGPALSHLRFLHPLGCSAPRLGLDQTLAQCLIVRGLFPWCGVDLHLQHQSEVHRVVLCYGWGDGDASRTPKSCPLSLLEQHGEWNIPALCCFSERVGLLVSRMRQPV